MSSKPNTAPLSLTKQRINAALFMLAGFIAGIIVGGW